jgi:hypothetical protein
MTKLSGAWTAEASLLASCKLEILDGRAMLDVGGVAKLSSLTTLQQGIAHRPDFCRKYLESLKRQSWICQDQISEFLTAKNTDLGVSFRF